MEFYYFVICHLATILMLWAAYMVSKKIEDDKDIRLIAITFYLISFVLMVRTLSLYIGAVDAGTTIGSLFVGLFSVCTYALYPMRKLYPTRFSGWNVFKIYIPFYVALIVLYISLLSGSTFEVFIPLEMVGRKSLFRFDVIFRFIGKAVAFIISITPAITVMVRKSREGEENVTLTTIYSVGMVVPGVCIILLFLFPNIFYNVLFSYQVWVCIFSVLITYIVVNKEPQEVEPQQEESQVELDARAVLWSAIEGCMQDSEPWRDPEFKLKTLSALVFSNRTTVSALIHDQGYNNFQDYVAWYRIKAFCEFAKHNHVSNIADAFLSVGFQSPSSAFRHFKTIHNLTPGQYLESLKKGSL